MQENVKRALRLLVAGAASLWLAACGGGNTTSEAQAAATASEESSAVRIKDTLAPTLAISTPSASTTYQSAANRVDVGGTASDNMGLSSINWRNDRGGSGTAAVVSGTSLSLTWKAASVPLLVGTNNITVTALDKKGNSVAKVMAVTYASTYALTVTNTGSGSVTSTPTGVNCSAASCSANFAAGSSVTLSAAPAAGYAFSGWNGACTGTAACVVTMSAAKSVGATFAPVTYALTASISGSGSVLSTPAGINCTSGTCNASFASGTNVNLAATPAAGFVFGGWGGACTGTANCVVAMSAAKSVTATFAAAPPVTYSLSTTVSGSGSIGSTPAGINCATGTCNASFTSGTNVTLAATPAAGYTFSGWSGACTGTASCVVGMSAAKAVTATFAAAVTTKNLTVSISGSGGVGLSSGAGSSSCSATCTKSYTTGATVTLAATPAAGFTFAGWGGACAGTGVCTLALSANNSVTATFNAATVATGKTYFVATTGSDGAAGTSLTAPFKTIGKALGLVAAGDVVEVRAGTYNETLYPRNAGTADKWITVRGYNGERPIVRGSGVGPTVYFYRDECDEDAVGETSGNTDCKAMYWVLQGLEIRGSAAGGGDGNAIKIDTPKVKLIGNKLCCSVADVVKLVRTANDVEMRDNEVWQDKTITVPSANAQGIDIVGADRTIVAGNYLHDIPDIAVYAKGNSRNTVFENNLLVNIGNATNGHALMLGQSTDFDRMVDGTYESYDGIIRNNVVVGATWACVATASSQRVKIYNNSCYNTGSAVHGSVLLSNEAETGQAGTDIEIYNNVFYGSANNAIIKIASDAMTDYTTLKVDKNIYWIGGADPKFASSDHFSAVGSATWRTNYKSISGRTDSSVVADPKFAGTTGTTALTLSAGSPAVNTGITNLTVVSADRLGVVRPQGGGTDIGAYELVSGSTYPLALAISGNGGVGVSNGTNTVSCTTSCTNSFAAGTSLTLVAKASTGYAFSGWTGACTGTGTCSVSMDAAKNVGAVFGTTSSGGSTVITTYDLGLSVSGSGSVNLSSGGASESCTTSCTKTYGSGSTVTLAATAASGGVFTGWTGACTGTGSCSVSMSAAKNVTATFVPKYTLAVTLAGTGGVGIANGAATVSCSANCSYAYNAGTVLALAAAPATGYSFAGWSGACTGTGNCSVTMSAAKAVTATFAASVDTLAPSISAKSPAAGATGSSPGAPVTVTFSEPMNCSTVTSSSLMVSGVSGTVSCSGSQATFTPTVALAVNATYTAQVTSAAKDLAGNALASNTTWSFTTGTDSQFTFLAYGDSRSGNGCDGNAVHISLVNRMVNEPASLMFNLGDMVTGYDKSTNWVQRGDCPNDASKGSLKEIIAPLQNKAPAPGLPMFYFPVMGNHDDGWGDGWYPDKFGNGFCDVFNPSAIIPNHTQQSYFLDKTSRVTRYTDAQYYSLACSKTDQSVYPTYMYYSFDFKNTHFVVLRLNNDYYNLEECYGDCTDQANYDKFYYKHQLDWLKSDLAVASGRSDIQNVVVLLHAPLFTGSWGHAANVSWPTLSKLFSANGKVKMVLQGHNHVYERSVPIFASSTYPNGTRDDQKGTIYTTTGGGGSAVHGFNATHPLMTVSNTEFHYLRIDVSGGNVAVKAIRPNGTVFDSYTR